MRQMSVVLFEQGSIEAKHPTVQNLQAFFFEATEDLPRKAFGHGIGFD